MDKTLNNSKRFTNINYNPTSYILEIIFEDGSIHRHPGISPAMHDALISSSSPEEHYKKQFEKVYPFQKNVK